MELNAETVKSELEGLAKFRTCPEYIKDALALINSQEQRIKELTEENERLKSVEFTCGFIKPHKVLECPIFEEIEKAKADTVRKMQTEIKKTFSAICKGEMGDLYRIIDQIAKEILEDKPCT